MDNVLTNAEMREADGYTIGKLNISSRILMKRAGYAVAEAVEKYAAGKFVLVVCGAGNNGGDGFVAAEKLRRDGFDVKVFAVEGNLSEDCLREKSEYKGGYCDFITGDVIVDCLFGTGLSRRLEGAFLQIVKDINASGAFVISADIPSGLNGDSGLKEGDAVRANVTVAIGEFKRGHFLNDGADLCGKLIKADIGITCPRSSYAQILCDGDVKAFFPVRRRNTNKGSFGTARLIAGSDRYTGAAALSAEGALKSGCGYVKLCAPEKVKLSLAARLPQIIFSDGDLQKADAVALGCGCGVSEDLYKKTAFLLNAYKGPLIIDADGLNTLSVYGLDILRKKECEVILTPHVKEFSRLTGLATDEIIKDPIGYAVRFAEEYDVILLLKNAVSVLTDGRKVTVLHRGNSALAKGGSGDLLTGFMCGTAARGVGLYDAAAAASYVLGLTAEICSAERTEYCVTSEDLIKNLHRAVRKLTE